jgi:choline dehydrogenase-like flavoprotein
MPADSLRIHINSGGIDKNTFDAIVIGSGISGGWAAKELCEHGLKTLVLERGREVKTHQRLSNSNLSAMGV